MSPLCRLASSYGHWSDHCFSLYPFDETDSHMCRAFSDLLLCIHFLRVLGSCSEWYDQNIAVKYHESSIMISRWDKDSHFGVGVSESFDNQPWSLSFASVNTIYLRSLQLVLRLSIEWWVRIRKYYLIYFNHLPSYQPLLHCGRPDSLIAHSNQNIRASPFPHTTVTSSRILRLF